MGIKDKVLDILFDDENDSQDNIEHQEHNKQISEKPENNPIHDTGSIFIDATSPLPVTSPNPKEDEEEDEDSELNKKVTQVIKPQKLKTKNTYNDYFLNWK